MSSEAFFNFASPIVYIDTETTGMGVMSSHRIIEIALVKVRDIYDFENREIFHHYLDIENFIEITKGSFMVHGISKEKLKGKPFFEEIADGMLEFVRGCLIIGHNVQFDIDFVNASLLRMNRPKLPNKTIDSRAVASQRFPGTKVGLDKLIERVLGLPPRGHHSALEDALYLAQIYPKLQKEEKIVLFSEEKADVATDAGQVAFFDELIECEETEPEKAT